MTQSIARARVSSKRQRARRIFPIRGTGARLITAALCGGWALLGCSALGECTQFHPTRKRAKSLTRRKALPNDQLRPAAPLFGRIWRSACQLWTHYHKDRPVSVHIYTIIYYLFFFFFIKGRKRVFCVGMCLLPLKSCGHTHCHIPKCVRRNLVDSGQAIVSTKRHRGNSAPTNQCDT